jgi:AraC family transcriptional regulator
MDKIHAEYLTQISLAELGDLAGLHPVHVARVFRRLERCSIGDYIRRLRVEHARRALVGTRRPIAEIALEAGFSDQSHLTRLMKRSLGITPAALRHNV